MIPTSYANAKTIDAKDITTNNSVSKEKEGTSIKEGKEKEKKENKHLDNMISAILKRLDSIEKETLKVEEKMDSYFQVTTGSAIQITTGSAIQITTDNEEETEVEDNDVDVLSEEEQEELEEIEEEFENEDNGKYNSFYGKLNAELNKLDSVVNKLNSLGKKYGEENEELIDVYAKVEEIRENINALISKLDAKQDQIVKSVRGDKNKKVIEPKEDVAEDKSWQITFSKELDAETVNGETIVVSDAEGNIIAVDISYNSETKQVLIQSTEGFESGKTYYLNISTNVKSAEGNNLSEAIEMGFTVGQA
jgi:chromosome segregation ATPase